MRPKTFSVLLPVLLAVLPAVLFAQADSGQERLDQIIQSARLRLVENAAEDSDASVLEQVESLRMVGAIHDRAGEKIFDIVVIF